MNTYEITKVHSTKYALIVDGVEVETFKTKGAAAQRAEELKTIAELQANKRAGNRSTKGGKKVPAQRDNGLTRKECVAKLKELGYTGPTSYLMPKLREIVAEQLATAR